MDYSHLIDARLDNELLQIRNLLWLPWVGKEALVGSSVPRLLVVGESHYVPDRHNGDMDAELKREESNKTHTREIIWECQICRKYRVRTLDNVSRIVSGPIEGDLELCWNRVIYCNIVQRLLRYVAPPERPSWEDFMHGWQPLFDARQPVASATLATGWRARVSFRC